MSDNTTLNPGAYGDVIRDIDKDGVRTQVVALDIGGAGAESLLTDSLPVRLVDASGDATATATVPLQVDSEALMGNLQSIADTLERIHFQLTLLTGFSGENE